jgi:hypothetical protein
MDMCRSLGQQYGTAHQAALSGEHSTAFALHRIPGKSTNLSELEASIRLDLLDHGPQGVNVSGKCSRRVRSLARPRRHQSTLACPGYAYFCEGLQGALDVFDGLLRKSRRARRFQEIGQNPKQIIAVN